MKANLEVLSFTGLFELREKHFNMKTWEASPLFYTPHAKAPPFA